MLEVMVRLEKVLERHGNLQEQIQINNITIDTISHTVTRNGEEIYLKPIGIQLPYHVRPAIPIKLLQESSFLAGLWGVEFEGETRTVRCTLWDVSARSWAGRTGSKPFPALDTDWRWNFEAFYKNLFTGGLHDP